MPERRHLILPGFPHHITDRDARHTDLFHEEADYRFHQKNWASTASVLISDRNALIYSSI